eukprot:scaffold51297_cov52-Cyclotella_meneghiniana.AAC.2
MSLPPTARTADDLPPDNSNNNPVIQAHMENLEAARAKRRQEVRAALVAADPSYANNPPVGADANPTFTNVASGTHNAASSAVSSGSLTQDARNCQSSC